MCGKRCPPRYVTTRRVYVDDKSVGFTYLALQILSGLFILTRILLFHQFAVLETPVVSANFFTGARCKITHTVGFASFSNAY